MANLPDVIAEMKTLANPAQADNLARFFKTGPGEYGEGDVFLGIKVPAQRQVAKKYKDLSLWDIGKLLDSKIHEHRLTGLLILVGRYQKATPTEKGAIFRFYLSNTQNINNWDLVDLSAPNIVGNYLIENPGQKDVIYGLVKSKNLWERRIAILATFAFIKNDEFGVSLHLAKVLLNDKHDLIHKAVGWMLREVGKRNQHAEEAFLVKNSKRMPRTMLRYAIERFSDEKKRLYMKK